MKYYTAFTIFFIGFLLSSCDLTDPVAGLEYDDAYYSKSDKLNPYVSTSVANSSSPFSESTGTQVNSEGIEEDYYDSNYIAKLNRKYSQDQSYQYADPRTNSSSLWNPSTSVALSTGMLMGYGYSSFSVQSGFGNSSFYDPFYSPYYPYGPTYAYSPYYNPYYPHGLGGFFSVPVRHVPVYRPNPKPQFSDIQSYATNPRDESKPKPVKYSSPRNPQRIDRSTKQWNTSPSYSNPNRNSQSTYSSPRQSTYSSPNRSSSPSRSTPRSARSRGGSPR